MTLEQNILVHLADLKTELLTAPGTRMNKVWNCHAYQELRGYGSTLIPMLATVHSQVPHFALPMLIREAAGAQFEIPDSVFMDNQRTRDYCVEWLTQNADKYRK